MYAVTMVIKILTVWYAVFAHTVIYSGTQDAVTVYYALESKSAMLNE